LEENRDIRVLNKKTDPDETFLVARARQGDKAAFGQLVKLHQRRVLRMVVGMTGDLDTAMDIVQDSFIRAYKAMDRFEEGKPFYPWISTIATNLTLNHLKKSRRETGLDPVKHEQRAESDADPLYRMQMDENNRRLMQAVQELPEQYRTVFVLRNFEDLSYDEIAARLNISIGTVDSRLYRARRRLVEQLKDLLE
jgi:RNA polymerase sigma-70 factor (ECF subfamily)